MKTMIFAAAALLSLSAGAAYAGDGDGVVANTYFTGLPGVVAQAPAQSHSVVTAQGDDAIRTYVTQSSGGTWLFAPNDNQGSNS